VKTTDLMVHIHLSETEKEVNDCIEQHSVTPVEYLHRLGLLSPRMVAAHCCWVTDRDIELMAEHRVHVAHNPMTNDN